MEQSTQSTPEARYRRGSEWRRWDLHVHTPESALNNGFGEDFDSYAKALFERAIDREIAVIGVTDYFTISGFRRLRELQADEARLPELLGADAAAQACGVLLLPNIELRLRDIIRVGERDSRVNMHVIFAEDVPPEEIEENFLRPLDFTSESAPGTKDEKKALTKANLESLGKRVKEDHEPFRSQSDLQAGMMQAVVSHEQITEVLEGNRTFEKRYLLLLAPDEDLSKVSWDGQGYQSRKVLIQKSHMLFAANPGTREFGLGLRSTSREAFEAEFSSLKPCVHGSDAHRIEDLFVFSDDRQLWIRANPSFNGLAQLLLGPEDRVFIGPEPPAVTRLRNSATKSIDTVAFKRLGDAGPDAEWFSGAVPLNAGLVAVIGKKGSGKSALADAIGLAGNAHNHDEFSFLTEQRFLNPKRKLGQHFEVEVSWRSEERASRRLEESTDPSLPERVKHIPQNYLEKICVEIQESSAPTMFDAELEAVIFSHVPKADRLGYESLQALVDHTTSEKEARIRLLRGKLAEINREYIALRRRGSAESKKTLAAQLEQRKAELVAHERAKPLEVPAPGPQKGVTPEIAQVEAELEKVVARIEELDSQTAEIGKREEALKKKQVAVERLLGRIQNLTETVEAFYQQSVEDVELLELDVKQLVSVKPDTSELERMRGSVASELEQFSDALDRDKGGSPVRERVEASEKAKALRHRLGEPERRRQEYERALATWKRESAEIEGSIEDPKSIKGLEARLDALDEIPAEVEGKRTERDQLMREIFAAKAELLEEYRRLYRTVQRFIDDHGVAQEVDALTFSAVMAIDGLEDGILGMIHQGKKGSFQGEQDGRERLKALIGRHEFTTADGVAAFLDELGENLARDLREGKGPPVELADQLLQAASPEDVYDFLFGLEYLRPRFELLWRGKPLDQLSPGERGTLLLIFYLLIDRNDVPLLIDQPEENLDNETVAELLVPAVRYAKDRRQIILVTHNPNLAVVCDADQVVHASIDKVNGNRITYTAGAIEDPKINRLIVDVLEGTKPAFDMRDAKYEVLDRARAPRGTGAKAGRPDRGA
jgi:hypothetical protein